MTLTVENDELLQGHRLKALIDGLNAAYEHERAVRVSIIRTMEEGEDFAEFELLTMEQEQAMENNL